MQEMVIPVMPLLQQQLPKDAGMLNEVDAQIAFQSSVLSDLQSDYCYLFFRIKNAYIQCGRIANPPERTPLLCLFLLYNLPVTCLVTSFSGDNAKVTEFL